MMMMMILKRIYLCSAQKPWNDYKRCVSIEMVKKIYNLLKIGELLLMLIFSLIEIKGQREKAENII